jgi:hypothetical protein
MAPQELDLKKITQLWTIVETFSRSPDSIGDLNTIADVIRGVTAEELHLPEQTLPRVVFDLSAPHKLATTDTEYTLQIHADGTEYSLAPGLFGKTEKLLDAHVVHVSPRYLNEVFRMNAYRLKQPVVNEFLAKMDKLSGFMLLLEVELVSEVLFSFTSPMSEDDVPALKKTILQKTNDRLVAKSS